MIVVGSLYWPEEMCRTGAASYLYYGGVFSLTVNLLSLATAVAKWLALKVKEDNTHRADLTVCAGRQDQSDGGAGPLAPRPHQLRHRPL